MGRACSMNGPKRNAYRILGGKQEGKRPLGRPICSWMDIIKSMKNWILHDDNEPCHRALLVREFLTNHNMLLLLQPPYSPD
jgi:hypothetical protein